MADVRSRWAVILILCLGSGLGPALSMLPSPSPANPIISQCPWVELLPRVPATAAICVRVFRQAEMYADEQAMFIVSAPSEARCAKLWAQRSSGPSCPDVPWPFPPTSPQTVLRPPAFYKLSLSTPMSFAHAVDMEPKGGNLYGFTMIPIEASKKASLTLHLDFAGCEGRDMLGNRLFPHTA